MEKNRVVELGGVSARTKKEKKTRENRTLQASLT